MFDSNSSATLVLLGVVAGVMLALIVAAFTVWLMKRIANNTLDSPAGQAGQKEIVVPVVTKEALARVVSASETKHACSVSVGVRKAGPPAVLRPALEADIRATLEKPKSKPKSSGRRFHNVPMYRYFIEGYPEPFGSLKTALSAAFPGEPVSKRAKPGWTELSKSVQDRIRREPVKKVEVDV